MKKLLLCFVIMILGAGYEAGAQFRQYGQSRSGLQNPTGEGTSLVGVPGEDGTANQVSDTRSVQVDTTAGFSIKRIVRGYFRKDTLTPGNMFAGALLVPGASQMYNRDYWKLPIVYGGIAAGVTSGILLNREYQATGNPSYATWRNISYIGAGLFYWASLLDGVICYKTDIKAPVPAKSTIYSILLPGLGQANNGDWWKIPIWTGGFVACGYAYHFNDIEYKRFRYICEMDTNPDSGYIGSITTSQAEWYRDLYRKYRDYSIVATLLVYLLQAIDANVFAYMADFDVSDNISGVEISPSVICPDTQVLATTGVGIPPALGFKIDFKL